MKKRMEFMKEADLSRSVLDPDSKHLSVEMIETQVNDPYIDEMVDIFSNMRQIALDLPARPTSALMKQKDMREEVVRFNEATTKRFGVTVYFIANDFGNAFMIPVLPNTNTAINKSAEKVYEDVTKHTKPEKKSPDQIVSYEKEYMTVVYNFADSLKEMQKSFTKGFYVDLKKAKIVGLDKSVFTFTSMDVHFMFVELQLTPREAVAIMMHEIGHLFTHIEQSYRSVRNTTVFVESLMRAAKNDGTVKDGLLLYLKSSESPVNEKELEKKSTLGLVYLSVYKFTHDSLGFAKNVKSSIDSEQLADQFAARFGLGADNSSALHKLRDKMISGARGGVFFEFIMLAYVIVGIFTIIFAPLAIFVLFMAIFMTAAHGDFGANRVYDDIVRRHERIRLDFIRQLRLMDLDDEHKQIMIDRLTTIGKIMNQVRSFPTGPITKMSGIVREWLMGEAKIEKVETELENLMENDLHVAATKFDLLGKGI